MTEVVYNQEDGDPIVIDLKQPGKAALLAWLWPGAGHFYQQRFAKGFLFMICILSIFFFGLGLGRGRVVYASSKPGDFRWQFACQAGIGLPVVPAVLQAIKTSAGGDPLFVMCERFPPPANYPQGPGSDLAFHRITDENGNGYEGPTLKDGFMAAPQGPIFQNDRDVLGMWHYDYKHNFDLGTLFTVVAGLLNLLAVYDAYVGPAIVTKEQLEAAKRKKNSGS
jgi:hypothetical protein